MSLGEEVIGREEELAALEAFLDRGSPAALVFAGEAGIGKTTLWRQGVESARGRGWLVLSAGPAAAETELASQAWATCSLTSSTCFHLFEAENAEAVFAACSSARLRIERVVAAVETGGGRRDEGLT